MDQLNLDWFAARLAVALYDTNVEYRMGMHDLREGLAHIPGGKDLTMRYEGGGSVQVFTVGEEEVRFSGAQSVTASEIELALQDKKKDQRSAHSNIQLRQLRKSQA